ncbi:MAG: DUF4389 domain-containing protein [Solirubrobacterales bacterium]
MSPSGEAQTPPPATPRPYPVDLTIDYQDRELNRTTTFFRLFVAIPILAILSGLVGGAIFAATHGGAWLAAVGGGLIVAPTALMIIFEQKYPRWWFDFNKELLSFILRIHVYLLLIDDRYPSTTDTQAVHLKLEYPDAKEELSQFMPIIKWLLAIPHWVILFFLNIGVLIGTIYAWFIILFTGRYPSDIFDLIVGIQRWQVRVVSYAMLMVTDEYPPFRIES